jgi:hypothetical protein
MTQIDKYESHRDNASRAIEDLEQLIRELCSSDDDTASFEEKATEILNKHNLDAQSVLSFRVDEK